ncbi:Heterokaryon incompatibility protein 6, OR allele [Pseudocercospora fuligena]|uniref:Heterokaryon incompatibility protein 6, OR allele n=1 Tax=Pseudocercospora fuligena TaxID=685502 RepID=A0A8H6VH04_9PEZI|nr:Heterokaryon incompatibility protein 6, OR allele [Pseudocercospora fuligena]
MTTFNHKPLSNSDNFRLLKVSVEDDSKIVCELEEHLLPTDHLPKEPPPRYAALSYTWGDPADTVPITCDGAEMQVTTNLAEALRKVVNHNPNEYLWVDQICINQQDYEEKSKQVQRMTKIYDRR